MKSKVVSACAVAALGLSVTACSAGGAASSASTAAQAPGIAPASSTSSTPVSASPVATTTTQATASTAPAASTSPASSPSATADSCPKFAATHTFLYLTAATENADGSLTVTGNRATMVCGGPDDFHYNFAAATVTGKVTPSGAVQVLNTGQQDIPITHAKFPAYLMTDHNVRVFIYSGPLTAITALSEQWHP